MFVPNTLSIVSVLLRLSYPETVRGCKVLGQPTWSWTGQCGNFRQETRPRVIQQYLVSDKIVFVFFPYVYIYSHQWLLLVVTLKSQAYP